MRALVAGGIVVGLSGSAVADDGAKPYAAVRAGVTNFSDADAAYSDTAPTLELELGAWVTPWLALSAYAGGFTSSGKRSLDGEAAQLSSVKLGARATLEDPDHGLLVGFGAGAARTHLRLADPCAPFYETDYGQYVEAFAGATVWRRGDLALQLEGDLAKGETVDERATLGLVYDPVIADPAPAIASITASAATVGLRAPSSWLGGITGAAAIGYAHGGLPTPPDGDEYGVQLTGWSPEFDVELGERLSPRWAVLATGAYKALIHTAFSAGDLAPYEGGIDHYGQTQWRAGARVQLWIVPHLFVAGGLGYVWLRESDTYTGPQGTTLLPDARYGASGFYADAELGIPIAAVGPLAMQLTNTLGKGAGATWTAFSIGVAFREP